MLISWRKSSQNIQPIHILIENQCKTRNRNVLYFFVRFIWPHRCFWDDLHNKPENKPRKFQNKVCSKHWLISTLFSQIVFIKRVRRILNSFSTKKWFTFIVHWSTIATISISIWNIDKSNRNVSFDILINYIIAR
jgi:hypothetical protein